MATSKSASDKKSDKKSDADVDEYEVDATAETVESRAVESEPSPSTPHHNFFTRLYTGTGAFEVIGRRKLWFTVSAVIIAIAVTSIVIRGFTLGIDFEGGTKVSFNRGNATVKQVDRNFGPSERFTADFSDLDNSTMNLVLGESGDPASPWFLDQWPAWYHGATYPMPFSTETVRLATTHILTLRPN